MFIRRTKTRTTKNGQQYFSDRLCDTYRVADRVHQRTLLNLGSAFSAPRENWKLLCQRVTDIILGHQQTLISYAPKVEREAQNIATQ